MKTKIIVFICCLLNTPHTEKRLVQSYRMSQEFPKM